MVGIVIPIQCEGGPGTLGSSSSGSTKRFDAKCTGNRKGSDAVLRKPMLKKIQGKNYGHTTFRSSWRLTKMTG